MMKNTNVNIYEYDKSITVLFIVTLFGVVTAQSWDDVLQHLETKIPQHEHNVDYSNTVQFHLWTRLNANDSDHLKVGSPWSITYSWFDSSKPTHVIIHGYQNSIDSPIIQTTKDAILRNCDSNVIGVDWGPIAMSPIYVEAVANVRGVGNYVCDLLLFLEEQTALPREKVHLIGHSLGAHAAGFAGKKCQSRNFQFYRITGLDPALPGFRWAEEEERLSAKDAHFVDGVYTSSGFYSFKEPICQVNFYMNGGNRQPFCKIRDLVDFGSCSHGIVIDYYAESVNASHIFESSGCKMPNNNQDDCPQAQMGFYADPSTQGIFYVNTRALPPFAPKIVSQPNKYCGKHY